MNLGAINLYIYIQTFILMGIKLYFFKNLTPLKILDSTFEIFLLLGLKDVKPQRWAVSNGRVFVVNRMKDSIFNSLKAAQLLMWTKQ
jgi:hypothetical protein